MIELNEVSGISEDIIKKLKKNGYYNAMSLAAATMSEITEIDGIGEAIAKKLLNNSRKLMKLEFEKGQKLMERRNKTIKIKSFVKSLDNLLGGGIETGVVTQLYGKFGTGKTFLAHYYAVAALHQAPNKKVFYVYTECFRPEKIEQFCNGFNIDSKEILEKIYAIKVLNIDHQILIPKEIERVINEEKAEPIMIIVDSVTGYFRASYQGMKTLANRQQKLNRHLHDLQRISEIYNCATLITNQVSASPGGYGDPTIPIGGNIIEHLSNTIIYLRRGIKGSRVAKLVDSPHLPEGSIMFKMEEDGIKEFSLKEISKLTKSKNLFEENNDNTNENENDNKNKKICNISEPLDFEEQEIVEDIEEEDGN